MTNETVMLTLDGTDFAASAIDEACGIASALDARVVVLEVLPSQSGPSPFSIEAARRNHRREAQAHFAYAKERLNAAGVEDVEAVVVIDESPGDAILRSAHEFDCDFVVMATHGRRGLSRIFRGSVAEHVSRNFNSGSVVLVHPHVAEAYHPERRREIRRIDVRDNDRAADTD